MNFVESVAAAVKSHELALAADIHRIASEIEAKYKAVEPGIVADVKAVVAKVEGALGFPTAAPIPTLTEVIPSIAAGLTPPNASAG